MKESVEQAVEAIKKRKVKALGDSEIPFSTDHDQGIYNGLELALSFIEERPVFYLDKNKKYNDYDIVMFPEYFL